VGAENALLRQSTMHPDGWGVAYYHGGCPHVIKSVQTAVDDRLFQTVSGIVASETVVAHLRKATAGELSILNTHPFQFGKWAFAHNGNIKDFDQKREKLIEKISPVYKRFVLGKTDSELIFFLIISNLARYVDVHRFDVGVSNVFSAIHDSLRSICEIAEIEGQVDGPSNHTYLSFVLTNGQTLVAHHGGQKLHFSTHKTKCSQRKACPFLTESCESETLPGGHINHLIVSSEPLQGENVWRELKYGETVGTDSQMALSSSFFDYMTFVR
jgi:glutamine amidotransferase